MSSARSAENDAVVEAARSLLRTASRPTSSSATAQVNAAALDRLRAAVGVIPPEEGQP